MSENHPVGASSDEASKDQVAFAHHHDPEFAGIPGQSGRR